MTYRLTTSDGTVLIVDEVDLALITAYLVLQGYPPVRVEGTDPQLPEPCDPAHQL